MHTYIIAEVGNSHEGSLGLARCFVKAAADCGVDAVKFQTHIFDAESLPDAPSPPYFKGETRKEYFDRTGFDQKAWGEIKNYCEECGVEFISSPFSMEAVDLLDAVQVTSYKIASGEVSNLPLLEKIAKTGKKVLLSSGMSSMSELDLAVATLRDNGCSDLVLMVCTSEYPCPPEKAGLRLLDVFAKRYECPVGFSDHTLGAAVAVASVALGAVVVEKHFALSKLMYGPDPQFSATPDELAQLVDGIRSVEHALRYVPDLDAKAAELGHMKHIFEKSIVSGVSIPAGTVIGREHLAYKKPGDGIPASEYRSVIGKKSVVDIAANIQVRWEMLGE